MHKGELVLFCKDFEIKVAKSKQLEIFRKVSSNVDPLTIERFKDTLPLLGLEMAKEKARELKFRLREIARVLYYPEREVSEQIEMVINNIEPQKTLARQSKLSIESKSKIPLLISKKEELESERQKSQKILDEVEKIMKTKRFLAGNEF